MALGQFSYLRPVFALVLRIISAYTFAHLLSLLTRSPLYSLVVGTPLVYSSLTPRPQSRIYTNTHIAKGSAGSGFNIIVSNDPYHPTSYLCDRNRNAFLLKLTLLYILRFRYDFAHLSSNSPALLQSTRPARDTTGSLPLISLDIYLRRV